MLPAYIAVSVMHQSGVSVCPSMAYTRTDSPGQHSTGKRKKGKVFQYSLLSVGAGADPDVDRSGGRLPLLSARPAVTSIAFTRWRQPYTVAHVRIQLITHLSTPERMKG